MILITFESQLVVSDGAHQDDGAKVPFRRVTASAVSSHARCLMQSRRAVQVRVNGSFCRRFDAILHSFPLAVTRQCQ